ncbi:MAG: hypothetical protein U0359_06425 [Byssovorax sp.]
MLAAGLSVATPARAAGGNTIDPGVRILFDEGMKAAQAGRWEEARRNFSEGWSMSKSPQVLAQLCRADLNTGHNAEAVAHLQDLLRVVPDLSVEDRARIEGMLAQAKSKVGSVRVEAPEGTEIFVDDVKVGEAPMSGELYLAPGSRRLRAHLRDRADVLRSLEVKVGQVSQVKVEFEMPRGPVRMLVVVPELVARPAEEKKSKAILGLGIGATAAFLGGGVAFHVLSQARVKDASQYRDKLGDHGANTSACVDPTPECNTLSGLNSDAKTFSVVSIGGYALGAAAGAATLWYALKPSSKRSGDHTGALVVPVVGAGTAGLMVVSSF